MTKTTNQWINEAWDRYSGDSNNELQRSHDAWLYLKYVRDSGDSEEPTLAAAEHYMFARYMAIYTGDEDGAWNVTVAYEAVKALGFALGQKQKFVATKGKPPSNPSWESLNAGQSGVKDGITYFKRTTGKRGKPFEALMFSSDVAAKVFNLPQNKVRLAIRVVRITDTPIEAIRNTWEFVTGAVWKVVSKKFSTSAVGTSAAMCDASSSPQTSVQGAILPKAG